VYGVVGFYVCFNQFAIVTNDGRENRKYRYLRSAVDFFNAFFLPAEIHRIAGV